MYAWKSSHIFKNIPENVENIAKIG